MGFLNVWKMQRMLYYKHEIFIPALNEKVINQFIKPFQMYILSLRSIRYIYAYFFPLMNLDTVSREGLGWLIDEPNWDTIITNIHLNVMDRFFYVCGVYGASRWGRSGGYSDNPRYKNVHVHTYDPHLLIFHM